jgi:hypothetical protein
MPVSPEQAAEDERHNNMTNVRYRKAFGEMPPVVYWCRNMDELEVLMEAAIQRGRALTVEDLCRAQGINVPPPDAIV